MNRCAMVPWHAHVLFSMPNSNISSNHACGCPRVQMHVRMSVCMSILYVHKSACISLCVPRSLATGSDTGSVRMLAWCIEKGLAEFLSDPQKSSQRVAGAGTPLRSSNKRCSRNSSCLFQAPTCCGQGAKMLLPASLAQVTHRLKEKT